MPNGALLWTKDVKRILIAKPMIGHLTVGNILRKNNAKQSRKDIYLVCV
jgi:hypothetical protein